MPCAALSADPLHPTSTGGILQPGPQHQEVVAAPEGQPHRQRADGADGAVDGPAAALRRLQGDRGIASEAGRQAVWSGTVAEDVCDDDDADDDMCVVSSQGGAVTEYGWWCGPLALADMLESNRTDISGLVLSQTEIGQRYVICFNCLEFIADVICMFSLTLIVNLISNSVPARFRFAHCIGGPFCFVMSCPLTDVPPRLVPGSVRTRWCSSACSWPRRSASTTTASVCRPSTRCSQSSTSVPTWPSSSPDPCSPTPSR